MHTAAYIGRNWVIVIVDTNVVTMCILFIADL
jgi:hypothetical protein